LMTKLDQTTRPQASDDTNSAQMHKQNSNDTATLSPHEKMNGAEMNNMKSFPVSEQTNATMDASAAATTSNKKTAAEDLGDDDVILGRGKNPMNSPGNVRLKNIVNKNKERYQHDLNKVEKTKLSRDIVRQVKRRGGRFLLQNPSTDVYEEVTDTVAREKVSHLLRAKSSSPGCAIKKMNTKTNKSKSKKNSTDGAEWGFPRRRSPRGGTKTPPNDSSENQFRPESIEGLLKKQQEIFSRISTGGEASFHPTEDNSTVRATVARQDINSNHHTIYGSSNSSTHIINDIQNANANSTVDTGNVGEEDPFPGLLQIQKRIFSRMNTSQNSPTDQDHSELD